MAVAALGLAVLLGWALDIAALKNVLPGLVTMKANTAAGFLLAGTALFAAGREKPFVPVWRIIRLVLAAAVTLIGVTTIGEYVFAADYGIDQLLFTATPEGTSTAPLGRMALANAIAFVLTGLALLFLDGRLWGIAQTAALIVALGLALTLFVTLAGIQTSLDSEIRNVVPKTAPAQFVLDIPSGEGDRFQTIVRAQAPDAQFNIVPALRGTIVAYGTQRVTDLKELPDGAWFLRGERGITYSTTLPEGSELVEGQWWAPDYAGPPLVSFDAEAAMTLGIGRAGVRRIEVDEEYRMRPDLLTAAIAAKASVGVK